MSKHSVWKVCSQDVNEDLSVSSKSSRQMEQELLSFSSWIRIGDIVMEIFFAVLIETESKDTECTACSLGLEKQKTLLMHSHILDMDYSNVY